MPKSKKSDLTGVVMWAVIIALVAGMFWVAGFETLEKWRHPAQNGVPNVFQEDREYWSHDIRHLAVAEFHNFII